MTRGATATMDNTIPHGTATKVLIQRLCQSWIKWQEREQMRNSKFLVYMTDSGTRFRYEAEIVQSIVRDTDKAPLLLLTQWSYSESLGEAMDNSLKVMFLSADGGDSAELMWNWKVIRVYVLKVNSTFKTSNAFLLEFKLPKISRSERCSGPENRPVIN